MIESRTVRRRIVAIGAGLALLGGGLALPVVPATAGPSAPVSTGMAAQNVDYLGSDVAASLNVGFPVLVPSWVPAPFGGSPSVSASDGYYSLYWMNGGGDPTFLQVTGQVGGALPGGSPYDLNNQLFINASVNGYEAIHDVTPIYDQVWWIQDGILYNVNSKNLAGMDSLGLANSLMVLDPGTAVPPTAEPGGDNSAAWVSAPGAATSGDSVSVSVGGGSNVNLVGDGGSFAETADVGIYGVAEGTFTWQAPWVDTPTVVTLYLTDANTGETLGTATITVSPQQAAPAPTEVETVPAATTDTGAVDSSTSDGTGDSVATEEATTVDGSTEHGDGTGSSARPSPTPVMSDGTDGPGRPVIGGDGTGGSNTVEIPPYPFQR